MSPLQFRATTPEDAGAVAAFLKRIFGIGAENSCVEPHHLHWKNWEERPDWPGSRGYILIRNEEIVAHATVVPLSSSSEEPGFKMAHLIDWAAEPKSVGSGATLLKRIVQSSADAILAFGGSEMTQKILPALGFKQCGQVAKYVRPLRPVRRLAAQKFTWRGGARVIRSVVWKLQAPRVRLDGWEARRVEAVDLASTAIPWPVSGQGITRFGRTPEMIAYYLRCPAAPMEFYAVAKEGLVRGYFMLAFVPAQARIVDFWMDSGEREDWRALIELTGRQAARNTSIAEIVSLSSDPVSSHALLDAGFHEYGIEPLRLLAPHHKDLAGLTIGFRMLDADTAYLHQDAGEFRA